MIILSQAYFSFFAKKLPERFTEMARAMGQNVDTADPADRPLLFIDALREMQEACGVADLKLSDYGVTREEFPALADNALQTMGGLFQLGRVNVEREDIMTILENAYR